MRREQLCFILLTTAVQQVKAFDAARTTAAVHAVTRGLSTWHYIQVYIQKPLRIQMSEAASTTSSGATS